MSTIVLRSDLVLTSGELTEKQISPRTTVYQCAACGTTIYSRSTAFPTTYVVRSGTIDDASVVHPGAHIWIKRKHPWLVLPHDVPTFDEDYDINAAWPREALDRLEDATRS